MRLEKETSLYKKESIKKEFEKVDDQVANAGKTATNFMTADDLGVMIADRRDGNNQTPSNPTGRNLLIDNDSVDIRDKEDVLASFGEETTIGKKEAFHSSVKPDSFAIKNGDDRLYEVMTDGTFTHVYMGGSMKAIGVPYSNAFVEAVYNYLSNGCYVVFEENVYLVYSSDGKETGYILDEPVTGAVYKYADVLDTSGGTFNSGKYTGIRYILESYDEYPAERFDLDWRIRPVSEIPNAPGEFSFGAAQIAARDGNMYIDAPAGFNVNGYGLLLMPGESFDEYFIGLGGYLTANQTSITVFVPLPFINGGLSLYSVDVAIRHADGGYPFMRNGSTYTQLGSSRVSIMAAGGLRAGISSINVSSINRGGFCLSINFTNALCKANGNTAAVTNNVPVGVWLRITGDVT